MEFILKESIHTAIANTVINDIRSQSSSYFYFVSGPTVDGNATASSDATFNYELNVRNDITSMKRLVPSDVSLVIPRIDWAVNTVYDTYDDYSLSRVSTNGYTNLVDSTFYVLTDDFNVYKCLYNNYNKPSTIKPTGTTSALIKTIDGYIWKFMYSIPLSSRNRFVNNRFIPIQTALTSSFYSAGKINNISILSAGAGYTTATITVTGDGTGAVLQAVLQAGQIQAINIINPGDGYTFVTIAVTGDGTGARIIADLSNGDLNTAQANVELFAINGAIDIIKVENKGSGYTYASVSIIGDGTGAVAVPVIVNGTIQSINVTNPGSGYTMASVYITGGGTGATARVIIGPIGGHGKNAVTELFAKRISFFSNLLKENNQGVAITSHFTTIGILKNVTKFVSDQRFYGVNASACFSFVYSGTAPNFYDMLADQTTGKRYRVLAVSGTKAVVQSLDNGVLKQNTLMINSTAGNSISITSVNSPDINKFSGDLLFIDNVSINQIAGQQTIVFKTTLKF